MTRKYAHTHTQYSIKETPILDRPGRAHIKQREKAERKSHKNQLKHFFPSEKPNEKPNPHTDSNPIKPGANREQLTPLKVQSATSN